MKSLLIINPLDEIGKLNRIRCILVFIEYRHSIVITGLIRMIADNG